MSVSHLAGISRVAEISHQCALMTIVDHLVSSPQVTERSCASLLALTMTVEPMRVESIHKMSQLTSADLPIPRPAAMASRSICGSARPLLAAMCSPRSRSTSRCHLRGPLNLASGVFGCPHGNAKSTNASGLSLSDGAHRRAINSCSSSAL